MNLSIEREKAFKKTIGAELPDSLLTTALDFIRDNMNPDEVFDQSRLNSFVGNTATPDEVFNMDTLESFGRKRGWVINDKKTNIFY